MENLFGLFNIRIIKVERDEEGREISNKFGFITLPVKTEKINIPLTLSNSIDYNGNLRTINLFNHHDIDKIEQELDDQGRVLSSTYYDKAGCITDYRYIKYIDRDNTLMELTVNSECYPICSKMYTNYIPDGYIKSIRHLYGSLAFFEYIINDEFCVKIIHNDISSQRIQLIYMGDDINITIKDRAIKANITIDNMEYSLYFNTNEFLQYIIKRIIDKGLLNESPINIYEALDLSIEEDTKIKLSNEIYANNKFYKSQFSDNDVRCITISDKNSTSIIKQNNSGILINRCSTRFTTNLLSCIFNYTGLIVGNAYSVARLTSEELKSMVKDICIDIINDIIILEK